VKRVLLLAALVLRCDVQDVVVAQFDRDGSTIPFRPCVGNQDCDQNEFCMRSACTSETGQCAFRPLFCDSTTEPVCGCDGVTYWNECVRKLNGASASTTGSCDSTALPCSPSVACPQGAYCARLFPPGACEADGGGSCWMLPETCPDADVNVWSSCTGSTCDDTCTAIASQGAFVSVSACN
jgi:hypothetical protein